MNTRLRPGYLDPFNNVARIICDGVPPPWLADQLWRWNGSLYHDRHVEELRPTRAQMRRTLLEVEEAALLLTEALAPSWVREFLEASPSDPIADPERLIYALGDLQYRASQAQNSPDLSTNAGATKPGPGKARPEGMSPPTLCAIMIWEAWKHVHDEEPRPKNRRAAKAAEAYWRTAGGEAHHFGKEPLAFWRHHLKRAAASTEKKFRTEWRRHLVEAQRQWMRGNSTSDAA